MTYSNSDDQWSTNDPTDVRWPGSGQPAPQQPPPPPSAPSGPPPAAPPSPYQATTPPYQPPYQPAQPQPPYQPAPAPYQPAPAPYQPAPSYEPTPPPSAPPAYEPPAYQPPTYQAPTYQAPTYQGVPTPPAYQQSAPPFQGSAPPYPTYQPTPYPGYQPMPEPKPKSNAALIIAIIVAVVLLGGGATTAYVLINKNKTSPTAGGPGPVATSPSTTTQPTSDPTTPSGPVTFSQPTTIGSLTKSTDQSIANSMLAYLNNAGMEHPFAVAYQDKSNSNLKVAVWGGTGLVRSATAELNSFFTSGEASVGNGATFSGRKDVSTGSAGGVAQCETVGGLGIKTVLCGWVGDGAVLGLLFFGYDRTPADALVPTILSAVTG